MTIFFNKVQANVNFFIVNLLFVGLSFALFSGLSQAHYLWLDPVVVEGEKNEKSARLYFGEFHENLIETNKTRLDQRKTSTLEIYLPNAEEGKSIPLVMKDRFYKGKLKTAESGLVNLVAQDLSSPVKDWTKHGLGFVLPKYYARTQWLLFKGEKISKRVLSPSPVTELDIIPITRHINHYTAEFGPKTGEEFVFQVYFKNNPLIEKVKSATVFAPNGWGWEPRLDKKSGIGRFKPIMPGTYVIEVIYVENKAGEFNGDKYETIRHRATFSLIAR